MTSSVWRVRGAGVCVVAVLTSTPGVRWQITFDRTTEPMTHQQSADLNRVWYRLLPDFRSLFQQDEEG